MCTEYNPCQAGSVFQTSYTSSVPKDITRLWHLVVKPRPLLSPKLSKVRLCWKPQGNSKCKLELQALPPMSQDSLQKTCCTSEEGSGPVSTDKQAWTPKTQRNPVLGTTKQKMQGQTSNLAMSPMQQAIQGHPDPSNWKRNVCCDNKNDKRAKFFSFQTVVSAPKQQAYFSQQKQGLVSSLKCLVLLPTRSKTRENSDNHSVLQGYSQILLDFLWKLKILLTRHFRDAQVEIGKQQLKFILLQTNSKQSTLFSTRRIWSCWTLDPKKLTMGIERKQGGFEKQHQKNGQNCTCVCVLV